MRTKSDDLKLIEQLEEETGIELQRVPLEEIGRTGVEGFEMDDNGWVQGLAIWNRGMRHPSALLSKFQRLETLALVNQEISDISSLKELRGLTSLHLGINQISDISSLKGLKNLKHLDLGSNQISDISSLKELKGLTVLDITVNQISDIASLKELKRLTILYLQGNQISDISSLKALKNLIHLNLSGNLISDISSLKELRNLIRLYIMNNKITHMPAEFLDLGLEIKWSYDGKGKSIYLEGNPLESPPVEIIKQGNEAIRQYFKSLAGEQQALKQGLFKKTDKELVFICYSRRDEGFVLPLCKKLKELGVEIWLDQWDIAPGDNWDKSIDEALYRCTRMLIILSPDAVDSDEVQSELYTFYKEGKPVFPIVYRSCRIPRRLNVIQHMNFTSSHLGDKDKIAELVKIITK